jgi:hypothetical protein
MKILVKSIGGGPLKQGLLNDLTNVYNIIKKEIFIL